ncbi:hypothetical protein LshimejAT787_0207590 [Lyophyllum shimeji]|uniref:Uncharacterized protein n=1 Tax=Lyophyllum shimeji TaxID=47721 RepID=A0A9P3PGS1_LYOSH|nr:hypothetical protein LshimejAT787_0207590 [Lyophyllum shimeji]
MSGSIRRDLALPTRTWLNSQTVKWDPKLASWPTSSVLLPPNFHRLQGFGASVLFVTRMVKRAAVTDSEQIETIYPMFDQEIEFSKEEELRPILNCTDNSQETVMDTLKAIDAAVLSSVSMFVSALVQVILRLVRQRRRLERIGQEPGQLL